MANTVKSIPNGSVAGQAPGGAAPRRVSESEMLFWEHSSPGAMRRLLVAALESFAERGFHGTTTRMIAEMAGMSPGALYLHFKSKGELLYTICAVVGNTIIADMRAVVAAHDEPRERLRRLVHKHVSSHAAMHTALHVAAYEFHALEPRHRGEILALRKAAETIFGDCLAEGVRSGVFTITDVRAATVAVLSLGISVTRWFTPGGRLTADQVGDLYAELVLGMVGANAAPATVTAPSSRRRALG